ncbi:MAG: DUF366 family protein [Planctomycetes bacterium]|nr:DUF366 family protein [Planctomycetota bacterium]
MIATRWIEEPIDYDGSQLRAHWILQRFDLVGDAMVAFRGGCRVTREEIADLADLDGPGIAADDMLHFLWETFSTPDLLLAATRQRLLSAQAAEVLRELRPGAELRRTGDDLYIGDGKLSISIATVSPVSALIHFALNCRQGGAPVPIASLEGLQVEPRNVAMALLQRVADETSSIVAARAKVRAKGEWR